jgi:hypothetical protein
MLDEILWGHCEVFLHRPCQLSATLPKKMVCEPLREGRAKRRDSPLIVGVERRPGDLRETKGSGVLNEKGHQIKTPDPLSFVLIHVPVRALSGSPTKIHLGIGHARFEFNNDGIESHLV